MGEYAAPREVEAPFNMAIATLKRLDMILQQIKQLYLQYPSNSIEKQKAYIDLVKQFYLNAVPLLENVKDNKKEDKRSEENKEKKIDIEALGKEIIKLKMDVKTYVRNGVQKTRELYSDEKEIRLNEILRELQITLKKFFMPGKRDVEGLI